MTTDEIKDILDMPVYSQVEWKYGIITRTITKRPDGSFSIDDTSDGWKTAIVNKETLVELLARRKSLLEIEFN